jgi:hypothetical protein
MLKKVIKYTDFNGVEQADTYRFNLTEAELTDKQLTTVGGYAETIQAIVDAKDTPAIIGLFKELILMSVGEVSADGKRFVKNDQIREDFKNSAAYSALYMELLTDENGAAADFVNGILPDKYRKAAMAEQKKALATTPEVV